MLVFSNISILLLGGGLLATTLASVFSGLPHPTKRKGVGFAKTALLDPSWIVSLHPLFAIMMRIFIKQGTYHGLVMGMIGFSLFFKEIDAFFYVICVA